jgi:hypothetical protein
MYLQPRIPVTGGEPGISALIGENARKAAKI